MAALLGRLETLDDCQAAAASSHHAQASSHAASLRAAILEDRAPLLLRGCVPRRTVEGWKAAMLDARGPPLVPFAGETTVSNERNSLGPPTTARRLFAGASGQLRTDAPDVAGLAVLGGLEDEGVGVRRTVAFATSARLRTPMHSDAEDGLLVHVDGVKRFAVAPPSSYSALARFATTSGAHDALFRGSDAVVTGELRPGDALYLPRRWLHDVESETPTLSIALRFDLPAHLDFF